MANPLQAMDVFKLVHYTRATIPLWNGLLTTAIVTYVNLRSPVRHQQNSQRSLRRWSQIQDSKREQLK